jgi:tetraacyldisaccharide 4'-kinase
LELAQRLPGVPHVQNADRVAAARGIVADHGCSLVIMDDGFQHRRLGRDLDIVLIDALAPFGFDHVFPRGMLREPLDGLARADVVALSRSDAVTAQERLDIRGEAMRYVRPDAAWIELAHTPRSLVDCHGKQTPIETLRGQRVAAFCGIGNPAGFARTLAACGCQVAHLREFADHHAYGPADLKALAETAAALAVDAVVCTHKDLVKLSENELAGRPLLALSIGLEIVHGRGVLEQRLEPLANRVTPISASRAAP